MILHPIPSEFPYVWGNFLFFFISIVSRYEYLFCLPESLMFVNSMQGVGLLHAGYDPIHEHIPRLVAEVQQTGFPE